MVVELVGAVVNGSSSSADMAIATPSPAPTTARARREAATYSRRRRWSGVVEPPGPAAPPPDSPGGGRAGSVGGPLMSVLQVGAFAPVCRRFALRVRGAGAPGGVIRRLDR